MSDILKDLRDMADLLAAGEIDYVDDGLLRRAAARIHHLEISSAQPAPAQREAVQVKPLEWCVERRHGFGIHIGRGLGFLYEAAMKAYSPGWIVTLGASTIVFDCLDANEGEAKAAAQADYEQRVRSCLVAVLVEQGRADG